MYLIFKTYIQQLKHFIMTDKQDQKNKIQSGETNNKTNQQEKPNKVIQKNKSSAPIQVAEPKQLRRIAERTQIPTDKLQLIQYLSERIKQAQDALNDTEDLLQQEVKERQKISKSLDQRNQQLSKLYQVDQRALPEKIKQKLNQILTLTVTQKMQSQQKLQDQKLKNYQYKARYEQLKWEDKANKAKLEEQQKKESEITASIQIINNANKQNQQQLVALQEQYNKVKQQKQTLQNKYLQMKVALDRMGDIKGVLNRFFGNVDLFDQKMDLKEQKVQRLPQPTKNTSLPPPSRDTKTGKGLNNVSKLKPIQKLKNDDEDFWKADFKGKNSAY